MGHFTFFEKNSCDQASTEFCQTLSRNMRKSIRIRLTVIALFHSSPGKVSIYDQYDIDHGPEIGKEPTVSKRLVQFSCFLFRNSETRIKFFEICLIANLCHGFALGPISIKSINIRGQLIWGKATSSFPTVKKCSFFAYVRQCASKARGIMVNAMNHPVINTLFEIRVKYSRCTHQLSDFFGTFSDFFFQEISDKYDTCPTLFAP